MAPIRRGGALRRLTRARGTQTTDHSLHQGWGGALKCESCELFLDCPPSLVFVRRFRRTAKLLLVLRGPSPAHAGLGKEHRQRSAHVLIINRHSPGWRCNAENRRDYKIAYACMELHRTNLDLAREMLSQRFRIERLIGLRVNHHQANLILRDAESDQDLYISTLLRRRDECPSPAA